MILAVSLGFLLVGAVVRFLQWCVSIQHELKILRSAFQIAHAELLEIQRTLRKFSGSRDAN